MGKPRGGVLACRVADLHKEDVALLDGRGKESIAL